MIDEAGVDEGLVSLDIDEVGRVGKLRGRFGNAVGAGGVLGGGHRDIGSESFGCFFDAFVIGGDDDGVEFFAFLGTLEDVLEKRFSAKMKKRLPGEATGGPSGRDDSYDLRRFRGRVQVIIMGFETLGKN